MDDLHESQGLRADVLLIEDNLDDATLVKLELKKTLIGKFHVECVRS